MANEKFEMAERYIASFPKETRLIHQKVRSAVKAGVPEPEEVISYSIPAIKYNGWIFYYSAYKDHYTLSCPPSREIFEKFRKELAPFDISKSSIKFPYDQTDSNEVDNSHVEVRSKRKSGGSKKEKKIERL